MVFQVKENKIPGGKYRKLRRKKGTVLKKYILSGTKQAQHK